MRWCLLLGFVWACGSPLRPILDLPPEVERAAALGFDAEGVFVEATPLGVVASGEALTLSIDAERSSYAVVVGYRAGDLPGNPDPATLESARLALLAPGQPRLPAPVYAGRQWLDRGEVEIEAPFLDQLGALTAAWLPPCPLLGEQRLALSCALSTCDPAVVQNGCDLLIDPDDACSMGSMEAVVNERLEVISATAERTGTCAARAPPPGSSVAFECPSPPQAVVPTCLVELASKASGRRWDVRSFALFPGGPVVRPTTYVGGLADAGDRVVVATFEGRPESASCVDPAPSRLEWLDLERAQVAGTSSAPPCLTQILSAPDLGGFLGVYGATQKSLGYFDRTGALLESHPISDLRFVMEAGRAGDQLFLVGPVSADSAEMVLVVFDLVERSARAVPLPMIDPTGVTATDTEIVVIDDDGDTAHFYDRLSLVGPQRVSLRVGSLEIRGVQQSIFYHRESDRLVIPTAGQLMGMTYLRTSGLVGRTVILGPRQGVTAALPWPDDPQHLFAFISQPDGLSSLGLFDPTVPRLVETPQVLETPIAVNQALRFGNWIVGLSKAGQVTIVAY